MLLFILIYFILINSISSTSSSSSNTFVLSGGHNTYLTFDSWRPCLTGYVRFDIRTNANDGTLAYIDDRGRFDFFYLKLIEGKLRLLFNLGNDRQALNVNMKINDDKWHTILIKRDGQITILDIDNGFAQNFTITHTEDLYFGGSTHNEYEALPFYFGGIPSILERPSSGNLSSFDVYMQPRFRGQLRNIIYKNCTSSQLIQPKELQMSGGISLIPNHYCSGKICGNNLCLIDDNNYKCLCNKQDNQTKNCHYEQQINELTFNGKEYLKHNFKNLILSSNEILTFEFKTNHYDGFLFELIPSQMYIQLKQGQLAIEYRLNNSWYETVTKDLFLIDNQWHYIQIKRKYGQITLIIDQEYLQIENDIKIDQILNFTQIFIGGNKDLNIKKFYGCLKDISIIFNESLTINLNQTSSQSNQNCQSLINPIQFLTSSSFISFELENLSQQINLSFHFQTYSSNSIILYSQSNQDFLGLDLIDGFIYITLNINKNKQRQELFQQRLNDGQSHYIQLDIRNYQRNFELNITIDYRQNTKLQIKNLPSKINLYTLTIGGIDPAVRWLPNNYFSGIMHRGFLGCISDFEINNELINLTKYINYKANPIPPKSGPCSIKSLTKRECLCEHDGECRLNSGGIWSCDCSKTGFTGQRCEQIAYHIDLSETDTLELNTDIQWSEQINDIAFGLQAKHDEENFLEIRPCRLLSKCDSIYFSIRNGLLHIHFISLNLTSEYPFLLDNQWHSIHLQRIDTNFLLHIDNHIIQQRVNIPDSNLSSLTTNWIIFNGRKQIYIEDLRLYDQSVYPNFFLNDDDIKLKTRPWKPLNAISFDNQNSFLEIQLNEILCQECQLDTIFFQLRTKELNGLILFANIQNENHKISSFFEKPMNNQYLILKLVNGRLNLLIFEPSQPKAYDERGQIQSQFPVNDGDWHYIFLHRTSDYHLELIIDSTKYYLLSSIYFSDKIYFGRSIEMHFINNLSTLKSCLSSLTINSRSINFREYIKSNSQIRNDCFLDSQCPLKQCQNTGICLDRIQCDCQHTSFQGKFCTNMKLGYYFNDTKPGLIFDQPFFKDKTFSNYKLSFGIVTKMFTADIICINDQIFIELYRGLIRIKLTGNDFLYNNQTINDGYYHLIQIEYNITGYLYLNVDYKSVTNQLRNKLLFEKPLLLLIGQNPAFKHPFQGQLYGLESDVYSIFDLISPTFQRITLTPMRNKSNASSSLAIIYPSFRIQDDLFNSSCSYKPYDDICIITSDTNSISLSFPNISTQTYSLTSYPTLISSRSTIKSISRASTLSYQDYKSNSTYHPNIPPLGISVRSPDDNRITEKFNWQTILIFIIAILCGIIFCMILSICAFIKYRRKDAGVYELEETQRFRPLIVEVPPSPGEIRQETSTKTKSNKRRKRKRSPFIRNDDQREFYI